MNDTDGRPDGTGPGRAEDALERLFRSGRANALLSWLLVGVLVAVFAESLLGGDRQWTVFVAAAGALLLVPPVAYRDARVMLPWELLALASLPVLVRGVSGGEAGTFAAYLAVAALALVVTVELHMFTALEVTHWFAVTFVVLTTMATVAVWTAVRWTLDRLFGTAYLTTNEALMVEWTYVTLAGLVAGVVFDVYFRRRDRQLRRTIRRVIGR